MAHCRQAWPNPHLFIQVPMSLGAPVETAAIVGHAFDHARPETKIGTKERTCHQRAARPSRQGCSTHGATCRPKTTRRLNLIGTGDDNTKAGVQEAVKQGSCRGRATAVPLSHTASFAAGQTFGAFVIGEGIFSPGQTKDADGRRNLSLASRRNIAQQGASMVNPPSLPRSIRSMEEKQHENENGRGSSITGQDTTAVGPSCSAFPFTNIHIYIGWTKKSPGA